MSEIKIPHGKQSYVSKQDECGQKANGTGYIHQKQIERRRIFDAKVQLEKAKRKIFHLSRRNRVL
jgi:hypothetical protein